MLIFLESLIIESKTYTFECYISSLQIFTYNACLFHCLIHYFCCTTFIYEIHYATKWIYMDGIVSFNPVQNILLLISPEDIIHNSDCYFINLNNSVNIPLLVFAFPYDVHIEIDTHFEGSLFDSYKCLFYIPPAKKKIFLILFYRSWILSIKNDTFIFFSCNIVILRSFFLNELIHQLDILLIWAALLNFLLYPRF